ncbi:MAG: translation initiation factor IF-2 [Chitinophagales bacterium]|nr:translation initiation factor IF-2 [Chitinophagales bacterium]
MAELKLPRLLGAAKEFNIGQDTLIDFLIDKGFSKDDLKPTSKLTEEMYRALQSEFQSDKVAKMKSDQVDLPKGTQAEPKKRKEDEEIVFKKEDKKTAKKEEAPKEEKPAKTKTQKEETPQEEIIKVDAPELEQPKVIDKIDLSAIDSSTRPKKTGKKKKEEAAAEADTEKAAKKSAKKKSKKEEEPVVEKEPEKPVEEPSVQEELPPVIENIEVEKLTGPKILGKIELPVDSDTRPKKEEKRKRKRIPIEKKEVKKEDLFKDREKKHGGFNRDDRRNRRGGGGGGRRGVVQPEEKIIDEKEIKEKIRQTQAKIAGGVSRERGRKPKTGHGRTALSETMGDAETAHKLKVTEFISVSELANLMDVSFAEVISKCMSLGIMVSINQRLDAEVIELVASEFGFDVEFIDMEKHLELEEQEEEDNEEDLKPRSPIVTIMGHVDHGKTSLLDYIRNANVVAGEAGGITQHIGAYQVTLSNGKEITFLDTPGHEAFTAMRARGAKVTDIAVIVIAADDAVMPQTREAISHAQAAGVPMIFAINKIDKDGANPQKIYEQLSQMNLLVEDWGGKYQSQEISAKKGINVDQLLEKVLLEAELLNLKANPDKAATGTIIEASLDKGRGYVATLLVENGTLHTGDLVVSGQYYGRVKAMFNERNKKQDEAGPSSPALILGLNGAPQAGEKFKVYHDESEAKDIANRRAQILREQGMRARKHITLDEIGRRLALGNFKELNVIIKGDVDGSVEALSDSLQKLSTEEILVNVIHKGVGQINESDVVLAEASDAVIIGFNVRPSLQASKLAENAGIQIRTYSIIYNAIEEIKSAMEGMLEPTIREKIIANVEIREVFKFDKAVVAGCYVRDGKIKRDSKIRLIRDGIVIYPVGEGASAELGSLKRFKDDAKEVQAGMECGLTIKNYSDIKVGDEVEAYEEEEVKRTL